MKMRFGASWERAAAVAVLAGALSGTAAFAQGMPGGGRPPFGPPTPATAASVPLAALSAGLSLTEDQKNKIADIKRHVMEQRAQVMPPMSGPGGGPGGPMAMGGDFGMRGGAGRDQVRALDRQASASIKAVLTDKQRDALPGLLTEVDDLRFVAIPAEMLGDLDLSKDQVVKIEAIADTAKKGAADDDGGPAGPDGGPFGGPGREAHRDAQSKVDAVLSSSQREQIAEFRQEHPLMMGRPGGGMRGPGARFGGPGAGGRGAFGRGLAGGPMNGGPMGGPGGPMSDGGPGQDGPPPPDGGGPGQGGLPMNGGPGQDGPPPPMEDGAD